jgi:uncharacterized membrane protein
MKKYQYLCVSLLSLASLLGLGINVQAQYVDPWVNPIPIPGAPEHPMIPVVPNSGSSSSQTDSSGYVFRMCNQGKQPQIYLAYAYHNGQNWVKEGWLKISQGQCSTFSSMSRYFYYYVAGSQVRKRANKTELCIHPTERFYLGLRPIKDCTAPYVLRPFSRLDINNVVGGGLD